ncbi:MAG: hypothetical protein MUO99_03710 [Dehalococcoidales bacterium]|nr:hypothetical protein [Dehalococcoidales bacterium]
MDTVNDSEGWFAGSTRRLRGQAIAAEELAEAFVGTATLLLRHDQAAHLRSLRARVVAEVEYAERREASAPSRFTESKLAWGLIRFSASGLLGAVAGDKDPLATALNAAKSTVDKSAPFGTVLVAVGKQGIPDDVEVISLSRSARRSGMSESEVRAILDSRGCFLTDPETFAAAVEEIEHRVLDGAVSLPLSREEFAKVALSKRPG